jgi:hypothetical protein
VRVARFLVVAATTALFIAGDLPARQLSKGPLLPADELAKLIPSSVFLDGQTMPVQKRNAAGVRQADGTILLAMLCDTSGYSSQYQEKYVGMVLAQGNFVFGTARVKPGAYGLGKKKIAAGKPGESFVLYDLGGSRIAEAPATKDEKLRPVTPLQIRMEGAGLRLYLGPNYVALSPR